MGRVHISLTTASNEPRTNNLLLILREPRNANLCLRVQEGQATKAQAGVNKVQAFS